MRSRGYGRQGLAGIMLTGTAVVIIGSVEPTAAQEKAGRVSANAVQTKSFNVRPQSLANALTIFGQQAGIQVSVDAAAVRALSSSGVSGSMSPQAAVERILSGTGLTYRFTSPVTVLIGKAAGGGKTIAVDGATLLETITVQGQGMATDGTGSYTTGRMASATGLPLSIRETPQSVAVISRQRLDDQNITTVEDAMVNSPGIVFKKKATADENEKGLFSRGLEVTNMQVDGVSMHKDFKALSLDTALYDRIEIVRGSTGLLSGTGNPAASINFYRKRPTDTFQANAEATHGTWNTRRTEIDAGGPLNSDGSLRGRVVGAWQDGQSYVDRLEEDSRLLYGVLEADLTDDTVLTLSGEYQRKNCTACSYFGFPGVFADGSHTDFPVSFNSATNWSRQTRTRKNLSATIDHTFENDWKGTVTLSRTSDDNDRTYGWFSDNGLADPVTGAGSSLWLAKWPIPKTQTALDASLSGPVEMFGREHDIVVGMNASRVRADYTMYPLWYVPDYDATVPDVFNWDGDMPEPAWASTGKRKFLERQVSIYGAARLKPTDDLSVILGSRLTWFDQKASYDYIDDGSYPDNMSEKGKIIPYAGIVYDLTENLSAYASYTSIFQPQQAMDVNGSVLDPVLGATYEVGLKADFLDERLNAGIALFQSKQDNYAVQDGAKLAPNGDYAYVAANGAKIRGVEVDLSGEIMPDWQMQASYAFVSPQLPAGFELNVGIPRHVVKLFTSYRLPGEWEKLTVGGGVRWESESSFAARGSFARPVYSVQESFFIVDLMAKYDFTENVSAKLNVSNVFDKKYFSSTNVYSNFYGEPLNARLSLAYKF